MAVINTVLDVFVRFGQRAAAILMTSSIEDPMQLRADTSSQTPDAEFRSVIHSFIHSVIHSPSAQQKQFVFLLCNSSDLSCPDIFTCMHVSRNIYLF